MRIPRFLSGAFGPRTRKGDARARAGFCRLLACLGVALLATPTFAASYTFSGASYPACSSGSWSTSGGVSTCNGSFSLNAGDSIQPSANHTIFAKGGITLKGSNAVGTSGVSVNLQTTYGDIKASAGGNTIYGNLSADSGDINLIGSNVVGSLATDGAVVLNGGSVSGNVSGSNGVSTSNGTTIGGNVLAATGEVSLTGGSVAGSVRSNCCEVTTNNTNIGSGISSGSSTVKINGGTIAGAISTSGGSGVIISNATVTSGSITTTSVRITITNSTIGSASSPVNIKSSNVISLKDNTTVYGNVNAGSWSSALVIDGTSKVVGNCTPTTSPDHPRCDALPVATLHHVRLEHSGSGVTCEGSSVTVVACNGADSGGSCPLNTNGLSGTVTTSSGVSVPFSIAAGSSSQVVKVPVATPQTVTLGVGSLSLAATASTTCWIGGTASCQHSYSDAGFIFATAAGDPLPAQTAGTTSAMYYLRAVIKNTKTKICEAALSSGPQTVSLAYQCVDPGSCYTTSMPACGAGSSYLCLTPYSSNGVTAQTAQAIAVGGTAVTMNFDANGNAPFVFDYRDVGKISLTASKAASGSPPAALAGASDPFVVKPARFVLSDIKSPAGGNPAASGASGGAFIRAGDTFSVTVTAVSSSDAPTPSFGREASPEGVRIAHNLIKPPGGNEGVLTGGTITGDKFKGIGVASVSDLAWDEVGIITLTPSIADGDYLGAGDVTGTVSENVGRFYPHHFDTALTEGCKAGGFTYSAQPFPIKIDAKNAAGNITKNYIGDFVRTPTLADGSASGLGDFDPKIVPFASFTEGATPALNATVAPLPVKTAFKFTTVPTAPASIKLRITDADGASSSGYTEGVAHIRYGRLWLGNAYGSELLSLPIPLEAQYWTGSYYKTNGDDSCTAISAKAIALNDYKGNLSACETTLAAGTIEKGKLPLKLSKPGTGNNGSVLLTLNLGASATGKTCVSSTEENASTADFSWFAPTPSARATFGIYKTPLIYRREVYR